MKIIFAFLILFYLCINTLIFQFHSHTAETKFSEYIQSILDYIDHINKSEYIQQAFKYSSTGSAQNIIKHYTLNSPYDEIVGILLTDQKNNLLTFFHKHQNGLSPILIDYDFGKPASDQIHQSPDKIFLSIKNTEYFSAVVVLETKKLCSNFNLTTVDIHKGSAVVPILSTTKLIVNNISNYLLILLCFIIVVYILITQKHLIQKGIFLHNRAVRHDITEAVEISHASSDLIKLNLKKITTEKSDIVSKIYNLLDYALMHQEFASRLTRMIGVGDLSEEIRLEKGDIANFVLNFVNQTKILFEGHAYCHYEGPNTCYGLYDAEKIYGVLVNLLKNALKHGNAPDVWFKLVEKSTRIEICIKNIGDPIHPSLAKKIFKPFSKSEKSDGVGLGLYNCLKGCG